MFKKIVEWINSLWPNPIDYLITGAYECEYHSEYDSEYETLIKNKYGIADAWADTEEDECKR